jgi:uncharacterized membrane protein YdjX (TVP38/TMEM64 family)
MQHGPPDSDGKENFLVAVSSSAMKNIWKWSALTAVAVVLFVASRLLPVTEWLKSFNQLAAGLGPIGVAIFIIVYVLATVLFIPGSVLTIGAGFMFGLGVGVFAVSIGSTTGAALAFLISRHIVREKIEKLAIQNEKFGAIDRAIGAQGWKLILLLRLSPLIPFNFSNYFYGVTAIKFWPYVLASWIGMLPATVLYVYLGTVGKAGVESAAGRTRSRAEWALLAVGLIAAIIATLWGTQIARKALQKGRVTASFSK